MTDRYDHSQPLYLVKDRQQGKTSTLIEWVRGGAPIDSLLGWSRIIIVRNQSMKREMLHRYRLHGGQVVSRQEIAQVGRGFARALDLVSFAIDDAEDLVLDSFPGEFWGRIKIVAMTGRADLMEAEIIRATLDDPDAAEKRLAELDARLADQPDPTLINAEGDPLQRFVSGPRSGYGEDDQSWLPKGAVNVETAQPKTAKKAVTKKTGAKRP